MLLPTDRYTEPSYPAAAVDAFIKAPKANLRETTVEKNLLCNVWRQGNFCVGEMSENAQTIMGGDLCLE